MVASGLLILEGRFARRAQGRFKFEIITDFLPVHAIA